MNIEKEYKFEIVPADTFEMTRTIREDTVKDDNTFYILLVTTRKTMIDIGAVDRTPELIEYIKTHEIPCTMYRNKGGAIVLTPEGISVMVFYPKGVREEEGAAFLKKQFNNFIYEIAGDKTVIEDGNDILVNGFKVSSHTFSAAGYVQMFNFNVDENTVAGIPFKDTSKTPRGLTELTGKTKEDFIAYVNRVFVEGNFIQ